MSHSVLPYGLYPTRFLYPWDSPGKNTGVARHALLQGIFLTHGLNPCLLHLLHWQMGSLCGSAGKESTCNVGHQDPIPGLGRSPGEEKGYPLQYFGLEIFMDCIIHWVKKSQTQLSYFDCTFSSPLVPPGKPCQGLRHS